MHYLCKPLFWFRSLFPRVSQHPLKHGMHTATTVSAEGPCNQLQPRWCQRTCDQTRWICKKCNTFIISIVLQCIIMKWLFLPFNKSSCLRSRFSWFALIRMKPFWCFKPFIWNLNHTVPAFHKNFPEVFYTLTCKIGMSCKCTHYRLKMQTKSR